MRARRKRERMASIHFELKGQHVERRQSLSIGAPTTQRTWRRKKRVSDQAASPLFSKLPVELREKIYEYALLDTGAVFCYHDRMYVDSGKVDEEPEPGYWYDGSRYLPVPKKASCLPTIGGPFEVCPDVRLPKSGAANCSLLRTCRAIYTEALPILYGNTQFVFSSRFALSAFLKTTPISKLQQIRSIRVECRYDVMLNFVIDLRRLEFCKNLQTMYVVWHIRDSPSYDRWEYVSLLANQRLEETVKLNSNCVFWCLIYNLVLPPEHPRMCLGYPKLQWYKYVDAKADPDWKKSEWQTVE